EDQEEKDRHRRDHVAGDLSTADPLPFAGGGQGNPARWGRYVEPPGHRPALPDIWPSMRLLVGPWTITTTRPGHVVERWQAVERRRIIGRWRVVGRGWAVGSTR